MNKKAQISTEYIIIISFLLIIWTVLFTFNMVKSREITDLKKLDDSIKALKDSIEFVDSLDNGSINYVIIYIPKNINNIIVEDNTIKFITHEKGLETERILNPYTNITGHVFLGIKDKIRIKMEKINGVVDLKVKW